MRAISSDFRLERVRMSRELLFELVNHTNGGPAGYILQTAYSICHVRKLKPILNVIDNVADAQEDKKFVGKSLKELSSSFVSTNPKNIMKSLAAS